MCYFINQNYIRRKSLNLPIISYLNKDKFLAEVLIKRIISHEKQEKSYRNLKWSYVLRKLDLRGNDI